MTRVPHVAGHDAPHAHTASAAHSSHPTIKTYVMIGAILAVITLVEVALSYTEELGLGGIPLWAVNTSLIVLSALKFWFVVAFFMHLKFDGRLFTYMFAFGLFVGTSVVLALFALFLSKPYPPVPEPVIHHASGPVPTLLVRDV